MPLAQPTEHARRLHELAEKARARPAVMALLDAQDDDAAARLSEVDSEFAEGFARWLHDFAHRTLGDLGDPTLAETPGAILEMIASQIRQGYVPDVVERENAQQRDEARAEAMATLEGRPDRLARLERAIERASRAYPCREDIQFYAFGAPSALARRAVLESGRRLAERDVLELADDVRFLELDEARMALDDRQDRRALVRRRKGQHRWAELHPGPPYYGDQPSDPPSLDFPPRDARLPMEAMLWSLETNMAVGSTQSARGDGSTLLGIAASAGRYTGPVRVILHETQFDRIRAGDVVVCRTTSPVWSVVFPSLGALVTDSGGILSHPAIIAREYRIPAVVATGDATTFLRDDQVVLVDGSTGSGVRAA